MTDKPSATSAGLAATLAYHQRTKHAFERYAAGPGQMDWATQPDPFRRYSGASAIELPLVADTQVVTYADLFQPGRISPHPFNRETIACLLELSLGLSAWKGYAGDRWALRCNPSSGNLHPTEAYLIARNCGGIPDGVHHYVSHDHSLELRCAVSLPFDGAWVGLSSIHWREAWKYGERAFRYCQHDVGHALAALRYAAGVLGWSLEVLDGCGDADIAHLLGIDRENDYGPAEREAPDLLCRILPHTASPPDLDRLTASIDRATWQGQANVLSPRHMHAWPAIDEVHHHTAKPRTETLRINPLDLPPVLPPDCSLTASSLIRQRRSAQAFDGVTAIGQHSFFRMLDACLPRAGLPPWDAWPWKPAVHLMIFIHRVSGLAPGLYLLARRDDAVAPLQASTRKDLEWIAVEGAPPHLRLFRLARGKSQRMAATLSCQQAIAGDSAFSLGMLAEFEEALGEGSWHYRRLFWECGMIGQVLYLEAEAAGVRGTGIGCFYDDPVHDMLGLTGTRYQSLYHFTVSGPITDDRLETLPPYGHLRR